MNTYKKIITVPSRSVETVYLTKITVLGTVIFNGKIFVMPYQTKVTFDLTDIFANYMYNGAGSLKPVYQANAVQQYLQPTSGSLNLTNSFSTNKELIRMDYTILILDVNTGSSVVSVSDTAYLRSNSTSYSQHQWRALDSDKPVSHYPSILFSSIPFRWANTVSMSASGTQRVYRHTGSAYQPLITFNGLQSGDNVVNTSLYNLRSASGGYIYAQESNIYKPIGFIDSCNAPYYLVWIDNDGAMVCHRFTKSSEYSEALTRNTRVSSDDTTYVANGYAEGKWKLKSYNLTDSEYEYYMSMLNSPYIMMYDTEKQRCRYVMVTDKTLARKTFSNNKKKPVFMEINVQETTPKNYIL